MALKWLRDKMKYLTWILWVVIAVFVLFLFLDFGGIQPMGQGGNMVAATVGSEQITLEELRAEHQGLVSRYRQILGEQFNREMEERLQLPEQALNQLMQRKVLVLEARRVGLRVSDEEVRRQILEIPVFQDEEGRFIGQEAYLRLLAANRRRPEEFEEAMREGALLEKLDSALAATVFVGDPEVEEAYRGETESAKIRLLQLPTSGVEISEEVAEEQLAATFADSRADYQRPERRRVEYLLVDTAELRRSLEVAEDELRAYYDEHPDEFSREEQVQARHILVQSGGDRDAGAARSLILAAEARIRGGEDFGAVAREISEDEVSAQRGGSLGYFGRGQMVPSFEEAAFDAEVGELVGPVESDFGFHLIEVLDHRAGGKEPFEQAEPRIRARLINERVGELAEARARELGQRIAAAPPAEGEAFRAFAEAEGAAFETTEPFGRDEAVPGVGRAPAFLQTAFALEEGAYSEPIQLPRGWGVMRLAEIEPARLPELAEVEEEVRQAVLAERRRAAALARLEQTRGSLDAGATLEEVAAEIGAELTETEELRRGSFIPGVGQHREIVDAALSLAEGEVGGPFATDRGAVLFQVSERTVFDPELFAQERDATRDRLVGERLQRLRQSLIQERLQTLQASRNERLLSSLGFGSTAS